MKRYSSIYWDLSGHVNVGRDSAICAIWRVHILGPRGCCNDATHAAHCNSLQYTATHCDALHHSVTYCNTCTPSQHQQGLPLWCPSCRNTLLHHTATHCNTLQRTCLPQQHQHIHTATHCNTLQHIATYVLTPTASTHTHPHSTNRSCRIDATHAAHCNSLQHAAAHCNTLHHTVTYCNTRTPSQHHRALPPWRHSCSNA